jgi:uncharacterized protein with PIN domain/sulfur carrier protein ThiS
MEIVTATFRFFGELNDFVAPAHRQQAVASPCAQNATVKHMIEALGVPHTEAALVLVDGTPAPLDQLLREDDRVSVYPRFGWLDQQAPTRFVADAHLGGLARMLRMAGFDTLYDNHFDDGEIAALAAREERAVLTRDRELLKRRTIAQGRYVHALKPAEQLVEVVERLGLAPLAVPFTLCLHCNAPLRPVAKAEVLEQLPASVRVCHDEFSTCDLCRRVYWKGSHWKRMSALLAASIAPPPSNHSASM